MDPREPYDRDRTTVVTTGGTNPVTVALLVLLILAVLALLAYAFFPQIINVFIRTPDEGVPAQPDQQPPPNGSQQPDIEPQRLQQSDAYAERYALAGHLAGL